mgnify:CR=1 FL=1
MQTYSLSRKYETTIFFCQSITYYFITIYSFIFIGKPIFELSSIYTYCIDCYMVMNMSSVNVSCYNTLKFSI